MSAQTYKPVHILHGCIIGLCILFANLLVPDDVSGRTDKGAEYLFKLKMAGYSQEEIEEILSSKDGLKRINNRLRLVMTGFSREEADLLIPKRESSYVHENLVAKKVNQEIKPLKPGIDSKTTSPGSSRWIRNTLPGPPEGYSKDEPSEQAPDPGRSIFETPVLIRKPVPEVPEPYSEHRSLKAWVNSMTGGPSVSGLIRKNRIKGTVPPKPLISSALLPYLPVIRRMARHFDIPQSIVEAVIIAESGGNPRTVSSKGAMGLMQLMPVTAAEVGVSEPFDPDKNIAGGCEYLRKMWDRFGQRWDLALAAYNAGPTRVEALSAVPRIPETVQYVKRVLSLAGSRDSKIRKHYAGLEL